LAVLIPGLAAGLDASGPARRNPIAETFPLIFDSERIRLAIVGDSLEVQGTYVLLCREEIAEPIPLFYPFPRDSLMGGFRMVSLHFHTDAPDSSASREASARWEYVPGVFAVRWWIPPCRGDTIVAEAVYRQKIHTDYARYIVKTTEAWGRPLRQASFEIRLPAGTVPVDFSFPFERSDSEDILYTYEARDFFPDRDIIVRWRH
jgi:hypothetical protein